MYVRDVRMHAFNGYLYTNKRTVQYTRAHILDRQTKGSDVRWNGWDGMGVGGVGERGRKESDEGRGGQAETEIEKHTSRRCSARSEATGTLLNVTNTFFLSLPELLSCRIVVHGGYMLIFVPRIYTGSILIVEPPRARSPGCLYRSPSRQRKEGTNVLRRSCARLHSAQRLYQPTFSWLQLYTNFRRDRYELIAALLVGSKKTKRDGRYYRQEDI
ncbi:uncharacterized protein LOC105839123 isoform X2 [Monomorium pharaonis]|uniref:uncharacterized protein LOC105839123 isoform X2 n=1 Tax=Monomorium pharaonis TaxID=307658 RepID=UPI001746C60B|nr:uncharacterized protein LOC105839123 isoform X2 [Monomorium pharaonis]